MKKILFLLLIAFFVSGVSQALAYDFGVADEDLVQWDENHVGSGGEFGFTVYSSGYKWSTFCVEVDESLFFNSFVPWMTVDDISNSNSTGTGNLSDNSVAWLYWNFSKGDLDGYSSANTNDQSDLQKVIWDQLGQRDYSSVDYFDYDKVSNWLSSASADITNNNWTNNGRVQILQLTNAAGSEGYQDVLIAGTNPVPEPTTMALLGIGLLGLVAVGRKKAKQD
jgi:PEP-CTERM motif